MASSLRFNQLTLSVSLRLFPHFDTGHRKGRRGGGRRPHHHCHSHHPRCRCRSRPVPCTGAGQGEPQLRGGRAPGDPAHTVGGVRDGAQAHAAGLAKEVGPRTARGRGKAPGILAVFLRFPFFPYIQLPCECLYAKLWHALCPFPADCWCTCLHIHSDFRAHLSTVDLPK